MEELFILGKEKQRPTFGLRKFITNMSLIINEEKHCIPLPAKPKAHLSLISVHTHKVDIRIYFLMPNRSPLPLIITSLEDLFYGALFSCLQLKYI